MKYSIYLVCLFIIAIICTSPQNDVLERIKYIKADLTKRFPNYTERLTYANHLVEAYLTGTKSTEFLAMHTNQADYPILQELYVTLWSTLAEEGWFRWHEECLDHLKKVSDAGKTIVYLGGGCDIYPLLAHGIYNITIVDPLLPTQKKYYPDDYEHLIKGQGSSGGINDRIFCTANNKKIVLTRSAFCPLNNYLVTKLPSGQERCFAASQTTWTVVIDNQTKGLVTFDRRYLTQEDLAPHPNKALLISWNELYFIINGNWKVFTTTIDHIFVKQLAQPLSQKTIKVMQQVHQANVTSFKFIGFGSDVA